MFAMVLVLVFVGFCLIMVASLTGSAVWAWVAVGISVAAAAVLVTDWSRRWKTVGDGDRIRLPVQAPADPATEPQPSDPAAGTYPAEPQGEVFVVDEQPSYHLAGCPTLAGQEIVGLPAKDAVAHEFTPCAVCTSSLAAGRP